MESTSNLSEVAPGLLTRAASVKPESIDSKARTVELVWAAGSPVPRQDFWSGQRYIETLSMEPGAVRLERLNNKAPLLNSHLSRNLDDVVGVVEQASVENGLGLARVRFPEGDPAVDRVWNKVRQGIVANVSVGYDVHRYEKREAKGDEPIELRAVDWEPFEISLVPMGADDSAKVREHTEKAKVRGIPVITTRGAAAPAQERQMETREMVQPDAEGQCPEGYTKAGEMCEPNERALGAAGENERLTGILAAASAVGLSAGSELVKRLISEYTPLVKAQGQILEWHKGRTSVTGAGPRMGGSGAVRIETDVLEKVHEGIVGSLLHRINPAKWPLSENAKQYRSASLLESAEEILSYRGISLKGLDRWQRAKKAFEPLHIQVRAGFQTTSDFANILDDVQNKVLRAAYQESPQTWRTIARRVSARDFKSIKLLQLGEAPALQRVPEHGEFTRGNMTEAKEEFSLATYGVVVGFTRQALINDDLDAFGRTATAMGRQAANLESDIVWFQIADGKVLTMGDGNAIFSTAHANFVDSGAAISVATLDVMRALMRNQKGLDGVSYLNLVPRYLIVGPSNETLAGQYTTVAQGAQILTPSEAANVNPFAGALQVIVEPRLEGTITVAGLGTVTGDTKQWYMAADPGQVDMVLYAQLDGDEGPVTDTRVGFDIDGVETKIREDFAAIVADYRGLTRNDGQ